MRPAYTPILLHWQLPRARWLANRSEKVKVIAMIKLSVRSAISRIALSASLAAGVLSAPVLAQEGVEPEEDMAQAILGNAEYEILVEGTKDKASTVLDFAGAITVINADQLEARQLQDLQTLSYAAPNVSLDTVGTFKGVANFAIRGLGVNSSIPSIDPAVGLFVDGVFMGGNAGSVFDTLDLEQVGILRGPQGVSFGRNTTGGAIMVRTADPELNSHGQWSGSAGLSYEGPVDSGRGTGQTTVRGVINAPLTSNVSLRIAALHSDDGGYFRNQFDGEDYGASKTTLLRGGLKADLGALTLVGKVEWAENKGEGAVTHNNGLFARDSFEVSVNQRGLFESESTFATLRAEYDLGAGELTNIFGWRKYDQVTRNDIDSTPDPIFESDTRMEQEQWSNELTYALDTGPMRLVAGGYLFHQEIGYDEARDLSFFGAPPQFGGGRQNHDVYGIFGQVDFDVADAITLKAGLRWSREEKEAEVSYVRSRAECSVIDGTCPIAGERVAGENNGFADSRSWGSFSPRLVATWHVNNDTNIYASWARGYRSGGYNFRITQPDAFEDVSATLGSPAFDQERVDSFELGAKWQSSGGVFSLQSALFLSQVDNLQREVVVPSLTSGFAQSIYNTADAQIKGFEIEARVNPADGWSFSANIGLIDAEYRELFFDLSGDGVIDAADLALELPRVPKWTYGASASYDASVSGDIWLSANVFFQHRGRYAYSDNNWGFNSASDRIDASIALGCDDCGVTVTLFGRNLLDEVQFGADAGLPFASGPFSDGNNAPFDPAPNAGTFSPVSKGRVVGVELGFAF